jgi:transcriptional regulator with XRE-family HTH domain
MNLSTQLQTESIRFVAFQVLLNQRRIQAGLSFQQLSERSWVNVAYLYQLETGRKAKPGRDVVIKIGIGLGLSVEEVDELLQASGHLPILFPEQK